MRDFGSSSLGPHSCAMRARPHSTVFKGIPGTGPRVPSTTSNAPPSLEASPPLDPLFQQLLPTLCLFLSCLCSLPSSHSVGELHGSPNRFPGTSSPPRLSYHAVSITSLCPALCSEHCFKRKRWEETNDLVLSDFPELTLYLQQDWETTRKSLCLSCCPLAEWPLGMW